MNSTPTSTPDNPGKQMDIIELEITLQDHLYYVSRESGDTFATEPYIMHTALYYALGFLPSRFRTNTNTPSYKSHFKNSEQTQKLYIHPATAFDPQYTTRQFSCKGDNFRSKPTKENRNLKATGQQRRINPGTRFHTFIQLNPDVNTNEILERLPIDFRVGKGMSSATLDTHIHTATISEGHFTMGHPVAREDLNETKYHNFKNLNISLMPPVDLIDEGMEMTGNYVEVKPVITPAGQHTTTPVALPTETTFLGINQ